MDEQQQPKDQPQAGQPQVVQPQWQYQNDQLSPQQGAVEPVTPEAPIPPTQAEQPQYQYQSGQLEPQAAPMPTQSAQTDQNDGYLRWTASEFVSHEKNTGWYLILGGVSVLIAAILYLFTRELFSIIVVLVLAVALAVFGALQPRTLDYAIGPDGVIVGEKLFTYDTLRSFAIIDDGPAPYIQLLPTKRLAVPITIYFDPNEGDNIIEALGTFLPFEHKERDLVDKISSRIRF